MRGLCGMFDRLKAPVSRRAGRGNKPADDTDNSGQFREFSADGGRIPFGSKWETGFESTSTPISSQQAFSSDLYLFRRGSMVRAGGLLRQSRNVGVRKSRTRFLLCGIFCHLFGFFHSCCLKSVAPRHIPAERARDGTLRGGLGAVGCTQGKSRRRRGEDRHMIGVCHGDKLY